MATTGGRGGQAIYVTRLDDASSGDGVEGQLRWALRRTYPRTIIIATNGWITLERGIELRRHHSNFTLVGHLAPGDGSGIRGNQIYSTAAGDIATNAIVRYVRFRRGKTTSTGTHAAFNIGAMTDTTVWLGFNQRATNWMVANCSFSWGQGSVVSLQGGVFCTFQDNIVGESLTRVGDVYPEDTGYDGTLHNYAGFKHGQTSTLRNLYAHHASRAPYTRHGSWGAVDVRNNVSFNNYQPFMVGNAYSPAPFQQNIVDNYIIPGPNKTNFWIKTQPVYTAMFYLDEAGTGADWLHATNNFILGQVSASADNTLMVFGGIGSKSFVPDPYTINWVTPLTAQQSLAHVTNNAGATLPARDAVDLRYIAEIHGQAVNLATWNGWVRHQDEVGGYPTLAGGPPQFVDSDGDGMDDNWEVFHFGTLARDGRSDFNGNGYTDLECFLWGISPTDDQDYHVDFWTGELRTGVLPEPQSGSRVTIQGAARLQGRIR
jgi:hypothetical protein